MAKEKIVVAGGGLVGATAAAIFADEGLSVNVLEIWNISLNRSPDSVKLL